MIVNCATEFCSVSAISERATAEDAISSIIADCSWVEDEISEFWSLVSFTISNRFCIEDATCST